MSGSANNPTLAKALTDPSLTLEQKQQLAKALVSGVMVESNSPFKPL
jgi:hypothetical protein